MGGGGVTRRSGSKTRRQTAAVLVRMLPEEKAQLDQLIPHGELGPLIRRLLQEHLATVAAVQPALLSDAQLKEATPAA
jgi:hypothetical protein